MSSARYKRPFRNTKLTAKLKAQIVEELAKFWAPLTAALNAGVAYQTYRRHYNEDPEFQAAVDEARKKYVLSLRREVHRRAVVGYEEPVFYKGDQVGTVRKFSDTLMLRHMARFDPKYREATRVDQKTTLVGSIETIKSKVAQLPPELREQLRAAAKLLRAKAAKPAPEEETDEELE